MNVISPVIGSTVYSPSPGIVTVVTGVPDTGSINITVVGSNGLSPGVTESNGFITTGSPSVSSTSIGDANGNVGST